MQQAAHSKDAVLEHIYTNSTNTFHLYALRHDIKSSNDLVAMAMNYENLQTLRCLLIVNESDRRHQKTSFDSDRVKDSRSQLLIWWQYTRQNTTINNCCNPRTGNKNGLRPDLGAEPHEPESSILNFNSKRMTILIYLQNNSMKEDSNRLRSH